MEEQLQADTRCVYFITGNGHVKIGTTAQDPKKRLASLQTGCPDELTLRGYVTGWGRAEESALHEMLAYYHVRGEWFRWCGLVDAMTYYSAVHDGEVGTVDDFSEAAVCHLEWRRRQNQLRAQRLESSLRELASAATESADNRGVR